MVREVSTEQEFNEILEQSSQDYSLVVVDFYTTWCGPCKVLGPIFEEVAKSFEGKNVVFLKVNCEQLDELSENYEIASIPTLKYIVDKTVVHTSSGISTKEQLTKTVNQYLESLEVSKD